MDFLESQRDPAVRITGLWRVEESDGNRWRWGLGPWTSISFSLLRPQRVRLRLRFGNPFPGQTLTIRHNGVERARLEGLPEIGATEIEVVAACVEHNEIRLEYSLWNGVVDQFPNDPRTVALMIRGLSLDADANEPLAFPAHQTRFAHEGDPLANLEAATAAYAAGDCRLDTLPPIVTLALTSRCNATPPCVICDRNTRPTSADADLTLEVLRAALPHVQTAKYLLLHCGGEPLLSPLFDAALDAASPAATVGFATNAMLLTEKKTVSILARKSDVQFIVSLDASREETYRIMRPGCVFETATRNVATYCARARELGRENNLVILNMTLCESNLEDVPGLVDLAQRLGAQGVKYNRLNPGPGHETRCSADRVWSYAREAVFSDSARHDALLYEACVKAREAGLRVLLHGDLFIGPQATELAERVRDLVDDPLCEEGQQWSSRFHAVLHPDCPPCRKPWAETCIDPNGDVRVCYFHDRRRWTLGNILENDFKSLWNGEEMIRDRAAFMRQGVSPRCRMSSPCGRCRPYSG